jgi:hypothetical protein
MFHICEEGKVKVWCNKQIYKECPEPYLMDSTGYEEDMVSKILFIID